jgi:deoxyribose-phosphate aldolase
MLNSHELENLVRQIGDELLGRIGAAPVSLGAEAPPKSAANACGCGANPAASGSAPGLSSPAAKCEWRLPRQGLAGFIDHTLLRPEATERDVVQLCAEARQQRFASVCVHPVWVARAAREAAGSKVKVATVIGFPQGASLTPIKCAEAEQALKLGAAELDMVIPIGALKGGDLDRVYIDIRSVVEVARGAGALLKAILEMGHLTETEKVAGCAVARLAGADFVKTSTGFGPGGAVAADVALMHRVVGGEMGIKAAGGIKTLEQMLALLDAGATRIGTSSGVAIVRQAASRTATRV